MGPVRLVKFDAGKFQGCTQKLIEYFSGIPRNHILPFTIGTYKMGNKTTIVDPTTDQEFDLLEIPKRLNAIRQKDPDTGKPFWYATDLQVILDYDLWQNFHNVIKKAKQAVPAHLEANDIFIDINKNPIHSGSAGRPGKDFKLNRYACDLIIMNADRTKPIIRVAMAYFSIMAQVGLESIIENLRNEIERDETRQKSKLMNSNFNDVCHAYGVTAAKDHAIAWDKCYLGLYGKSCRQLKADRNINNKNETPLNFMETEELLFNSSTRAALMAAIQITPGLKGDKNTFFRLCETVFRNQRDNMIRAGFTAPENMPIANISASRLPARIKKLQGKLNDAEDKLITQSELKVREIELEVV